MLGGTRFIGRAIVDELWSSGDDITICHRGQTEPPDLPELKHVHVDRLRLRDEARSLGAFDPEAVVDCNAGGRRDTAEVLEVLPDPDVHFVALSSADVYRAYDGLHHDIATDPVPLDEKAPVREARYPYRWQFPDRAELADYEKLDVEELYLERGATVLRLASVYGERDYARREWFVLRRVVGRRRRIPVGAGNLVFSRVYVRDVARAVRMALSSAAARGEVFNIAERSTPSVALLARLILDAASWEADLVRVAEDHLPDDLKITKTFVQDLLLDASKARRVMGWAETSPSEWMSASVAWHLAHPPDDTRPFDADDEALAARL